MSSGDGGMVPPPDLSSGGSGLHITTAPFTIVSGDSNSIAAAGGMAPYQWAVVSNNSQGSINQSGNYTAGAIAATDTVQVTDATMATAQIQLTVVSAPTVTLSPPSALSNHAINVQLRTAVHSTIASVMLSNGGTVMPGPMQPDGTAMLQLMPGADGADLLQVQVTGFGATNGSGSGTYTFDTVPPAAPTITSPADQSTVVGPTLTISGTAEPNSKVTMYASSPSGGVQQGQVTADGTGSFSFINPNQANGQFALFFKATDAAGNQSQASAILHARLTNGAAQALMIFPSGPQVGTGGIVNFSVQGGTPPYTFAFQTNASNATVDSWGIYTAGPTSGTDYVTVTDSVNTTVTTTVTVLAPLSVVINQPANSSTVTSLPLTVSGTAPAGSNLQVLLDNMPVTGGPTMGSFSFQLMQSLSSGQHTVEVDATQGSSSGKATSTFTYQQQALQLMSPPNNANVTPPITLSGTAQPMQQVTVFLDGTQVGTPTADGAGNWSFPLASSPSAGSHTWYATAGMQQTQPFTFNVNGPITGTQIITYVNDSGTTTAPANLSQAFIQVYVSDAMGNFTSYQGTGAADGTFSIPNVPQAASYLIGVNGQFWATSSRTLDLGFTKGGRADAQPAPAGSTTVLNLSNLAAWVTGVPNDFTQPGDAIQVHSSTLGMVNYPDASALKTGDVSTNNDLTVDWSPASVQNGMADVSLLVGGTDTVTVSQFVYGTLPSGTTGVYQVLGKYAVLPAFTQQPGISNTQAVVLGDVMQSQTLNVNWPRSQFETLTTQVNPNATTTTTDFIGGTGVQARVGFSSASPMQFQDNLKTDLNASFSYGDPYPSTWVEQVQFQYLVNVNLTAPGATNPAQFTAGSISNELVSTVNAQAITPRVGPVASLTIDGQSAFGSSISNVSVVPTLSWKPGVGTTHNYNVTLFQVSKDGSGNTNYNQIHVFNTTSTSVAIPPSILNGGGSAYFVQVKSWYAPSYDPAHPNERPTATNAWSTAVSNVFTTSPTALGVSSPADGSTVVAGTINLQGTAPPNQIVNVFMDGNPVGQATAGPTGQWSIQTTAAAGQHNFGAGYGSLFSLSNSFTAQ
jgi:hypothetical protein